MEDKKGLDRFWYMFLGRAVDGGWTGGLFFSFSFCLRQACVSRFPLCASIGPIVEMVHHSPSELYPEIPTSVVLPRILHILPFSLASAAPDDYLRKSPQCAPQSILYCPGPPLPTLKAPPPQTPPPTAQPND